MTGEKLVCSNRWFVLYAVLTLILVGPAAAFCADQPWTTVASAGTVDEGDINEVTLNGAFVTVSAAPPSGVLIRYNVVAMDDLFDRCLKMTARFRDNGDASQVIVRLKRLNLTSGATVTLLTLDSDTFIANDAYQVHSVDSCDLTLNFESNAYFIEAELNKFNRTGANGNPGLASIKLDTSP